MHDNAAGALWTGPSFCCNELCLVSSAANGERTMIICAPQRVDQFAFETNLDETPQASHSPELASKHVPWPGQAGMTHKHLMLLLLAGS